MLCRKVVCNGIRPIYSFRRRSNMAKLYVLNGAQAGKSFELREGNNYVGRSSEDIHIKDPTVSREHLRITVRRGRYYLTDLGGRNRTFLDGNYLAPGLEYEVT